MPDLSALLALLNALMPYVAGAGGVWVLFDRWMERRANAHKVTAEAHEDEATAAETITRAAQAAVKMQLEASEANCRELIRKAVADSEARCEERSEQRKQERDREIAALREEHARQMAGLTEWGKRLEREGCERNTKQQQQIDFLSNRLAERDDLLAAREAELAQMVEEAREGR